MYKYYYGIRPRLIELNSVCTKYECNLNILTLKTYSTKRCISLKLFFYPK